MWYRTGTISLTNGSAAVTGAGTDFLSGAAAGEGLKAPDGQAYEILSVNSATGITLGSPYLGATAAGQAYAIIPTQAYIRDLASQAATLVNEFAGVRDAAGAGKFGDGTQAIPGMRFTADEDTGWRRVASNVLALVAGAVDQLKAGVDGIRVTAADKATPVDADTVMLGDSAATGVLRGLTWANLKATLKTYFDSVATTLTNKTLTSPVINTIATINATYPELHLKPAEWATPAYVQAGVNAAGVGGGNCLLANVPTGKGFSWAVANVAKMQLDAAGTLGLGVTPSAWSLSGMSALQIKRGGVYGYDPSGEIGFTSNAYYDLAWKYTGTGNAMLFSMGEAGPGIFAWKTAPSGTAGNPVTFTQVMTLDVTGNLAITPGDVGAGPLTLGGNGQSMLYSGGANAGYTSGMNGAATVLFIAKNSTTGRSINSAGTNNASGADYAEYERNNGLTITKGSIVGFKVDGTLTTTFDEAIRFAIKSTDPSYVGGDTWGTEDKVGNRPDEPQRIADKTEQRLVSEAVQAVVGVAAQPAVAASPAEYATVTTEEVVLVDGVESVITRHQLVETKAAVTAQAAIEAVAAVDAQEAVYETIITEAGDTDAGWAAKQAAYATAKAAFEAALEAARQQVDRIAYSGKVPCNVLGATPGGYIIASELDGHIAGQFVADPDFAQYKKAVGRVNRILPDGRCEVAVIIH